MVKYFSDKKLNKLYPDLKFISHFITKHVRPQIENIVSYMRDTIVCHVSYLVPLRHSTKWAHLAY